LPGLYGHEISRKMLASGTLVPELARVQVSAQVSASARQGV
jgi:hypothetical protein